MRATASGSAGDYSVATTSRRMDETCAASAAQGPVGRRNQWLIDQACWAGEIDPEMASVTAKMPLAAPSGVFWRRQGQMDPVNRWTDGATCRRNLLVTWRRLQRTSGSRAAPPLKGERCLEHLVKLARKFSAGGQAFRRRHPD